MNNHFIQTNQEQSIQTKLPLLAKIFIALILIAGFFNVIVAFQVFLIGSITFGILAGIVGISQIIIVAGLINQKKWSLYALTIFTLVYAILILVFSPDIKNVLIAVIEVLIVGYFWSIYKKFTSKQSIIQRPRIIWAILIVIAIIIIGGGVYLWQKNKIPDWKTYKDQEYGFEIKYPSENFPQIRDHQIRDDWKTYKDQEYGFEVKYPSNFAKDENFIDGALSSVGFGLPYAEVFGKKHPYRNSVTSFEIVVYKEESDIGSFIQKQQSDASEVEKISKEIGQIKIDNTPAIIIEYCNMGGICNNSYYFSHNDFIYIINNNFEQNKANTELFNNMFFTFKFIGSLSKFCTDPLKPTDIGYDELPIDPKYKNLNWLGQIFTAYNCGLERVDKIFGVENGFFTTGLNITLKNYPDGQLINIFNSLGFSCIDKSSNSAGNCKEWGCEKSIKIDDLMKLEPYYNNFQRDDCVHCG